MTILLTLHLVAPLPVYHGNTRIPWCAQSIKWGRRRYKTGRRRVVLNSCWCARLPWWWWMCCYRLMEEEEIQDRRLLDEEWKAKRSDPLIAKPASASASPVSPRRKGGGERKYKIYKKSASPAVFFFLTLGFYFSSRIFWRCGVVSVSVLSF